jgi:hypothetical protein
LVDARDQSEIGTDGPVQVRLLDTDSAQAIHGMGLSPGQSLFVIYGPYDFGSTIGRIQIENDPTFAASATLYSSLAGKPSIVNSSSSDASRLSWALPSRTVMVGRNDANITSSAKLLEGLTPQEQLGIVYSMNATFEEVIDLLNAGTLRITLETIGSRRSTATYQSQSSVPLFAALNVVPEPESALIWGILALVAMVGAARMSRRPAAC